LKVVNPRLIYVSLTGYGPDGPYANRPGYDVIAASEGGLVGITGPQEGAPCKVGVAMTDLSTGLFAHGAILAALFQRSTTNIGQKIDVNLLSTQVSCLINIGANYLNANVHAKRLGTSHASLVPYESFETSEGGYITICSGSDAQFNDLCHRLGLPELASDPQYKNNASRVNNRHTLVTILKEKFLTANSDHWLDVLKGGLSPYGRVNTMQQVFDDPHIKAIQLVKTVEHPTAGQIKLVGPPVKYSLAANEINRPPPVLGQHTDEVLKEILNYSNNQIELLRERNAIL
jgi:succinate--hydroxymethylglutarate CoA-transferase